MVKITACSTEQGVPVEKLLKVCVFITTVIHCATVYIPMYILYIIIITT
jgi:hypothetical protein